MLSDCQVSQGVTKSSNDATFDRMSFSSLNSSVKWYLFLMNNRLVVGGEIKIPDLWCSISYPTPRYLGPVRRRCLSAL